MGTRVFSLTGLFPYDELSENLYGSLPHRPLTMKPVLTPGWLFVMLP